MSLQSSELQAAGRYALVLVDLSLGSPTPA